MRIESDINASVSTGSAADSALRCSALAVRPVSAVRTSAESHAVSREIFQPTDPAEQRVQRDRGGAVQTVGQLARVRALAAGEDQQSGDDGAQRGGEARVVLLASVTDFGERSPPDKRWVIVVEC